MQGLKTRTLNGIIYQRGDVMVMTLIMSIDDSDDRDFVREIYHRYERILHQYAQKMLENEAYVEDCVHDVFRGIIERLEKFKKLDEERQVKYMMLACRNTAINKYNNRKKSISLTVEGEAQMRKEMEIKDESSDVCEIVINNELRDIVRNLIDSLEEKYRDPVVFRYEYCYEIKEIAEILHISEELVRQRIKRARDKIKKAGGKKLHELFK